MYSRIDALQRQIKIESLKSFQRLSYKTQVFMLNKNNTLDTATNRLTHSYLVKAGSEIICEHLSLNGVNVNYKYAIGNVSLTHDIGQSPFGHKGASTISSEVKVQGLKDGFDDNSNNYKVIFKNGGYNLLSDYELASIMKYPHKLYEEQKGYLLPILDRAIIEDVKEFEKQGVKIYQKPKRTIACEIMDQADRNAYVCSDLSDFFTLKFNEKSSLRIGDNTVDHDNFENKILSREYNDVQITEILYSIYSGIKNKNTNLVRSSFNNLFYLLNTNYYISDNITLCSKNQELEDLREDLYELETEFYINNPFIVKENKNNQENFTKYIRYVIANEHYTSKTYSKMISKTKNDIDKIKLIRDMLGECTDWFIYHKLKELKIS